MFKFFKNKRSASAVNIENIENDSLSSPTNSSNSFCIANKLKKQHKIRIRKIVMPEKFIIEKVNFIEKKDIVNYIKGKSFALFGDNYYYAYLYEKNTLVFVSGYSDKYIENNIPLVIYALLNCGKYYFKSSGQQYHIIENTIDNIKHIITYEKPTDAVELTVDLVQNIKKIPATMKFHWSLRKRNFEIVFVLLCVISMLFYIIMSIYATNVKSNTLRRINIHEIVKNQNKKNIDISLEIAKLADKIKPNGVIEKITLNGNNITFVIFFKDELSMQNFLKLHGGKNEQDKVVYTTSASVN